ETLRAEHEARIAETGRDLQAARDLARDSQNQTQRLAGELAAAQDALAAATRDHDAERSRLIAASGERDARLAALTQELQSAQQALREHDARLQARDAQIEALAAASRAQVKALTAERDVTRQQADRAAAERDAAAQ